MTLFILFLFSDSVSFIGANYSSLGANFATVGANFGVTFVTSGVRSLNDVTGRKKVLKRKLT